MPTTTWPPLLALVIWIACLRIYGEPFTFCVNYGSAAMVGFTIIDFPV